MIAPRFALILIFAPALLPGLSHAGNSNAGNEIESLNKALIAKAAEIQSLEHEITRTSTHLNQLRGKLGEMEKNRQKHTKTQKAGSASLIRLARRPKNMPFVSGLDLVRGELILSRMQKQTDHMLARLIKRNHAIAQLTADVQKNEQALKQDLKKLKHVHQALEKLLESKKKGLKTEKSAYWMERAKNIAAKSHNTNVLVSAMIKKTKRRSIDKKSDDIKFLKPGTGKLMTGYGHKNALGMYSLGLDFAMVSQARITAPIGGQILFAGPFRSYGQILIVAAPGGYHLLLRGMDRVDVRAGDALSAGEPIGLMPPAKKQADRSKKSYNADNLPILYLEVRKHGRPINPASLFVEDIR